MGQEFDSIIFDMDGTLWDSASVVCDAWNEVFAGCEDIDKVVSVEEMHGCMGLLMPEIMKRLLPQTDEQRRLILLKECCEMEHEFIEKKGGILYDELESTLKELSKTYRLFIVSNCQDGYIQCFFKAHGLGKYFEDFESAGKTGLVKGENIRLVIERNNLKNAVYVGDTQGDANAARLAGIPFIYATYGFGKVDGYDFIIDAFSEIPKVLSVK